MNDIKAAVKVLCKQVMQKDGWCSCTGVALLWHLLRSMRLLHIAHVHQQHCVLRLLLANKTWAPLCTLL